MALTQFQREVTQTIAANRRASGDSYVAGGAALNLLLQSPRLSSDVDLFHDTREAVHRAYAMDRSSLDAAGFTAEVELERDTFVQAVVRRGASFSRLQWSLDSAYRFFPLVEHAELGLTLHAFDLATNKVLALVGRAEPRDWVDTIECDRRLQPLGYLAWAAAGKDPGLNPALILEQAGRSARYTEVELARVAFEGERPTAAALSTEWRRILAEARAVVQALPAPEVGCCVYFPNGDLVSLQSAALGTALAAGTLRFHPGSLLGAYPVLV